MSVLQKMYGFYNGKIAKYYTHSFPPINITFPKTNNAAESCFVVKKLNLYFWGYMYINLGEKTKTNVQINKQYGV